MSDRRLKTLLFLCSKWVTIHMIPLTLPSLSTHVLYVFWRLNSGNGLQIFSGKYTVFALATRSREEQLQLLMHFDGLWDRFSKYIELSGVVMMGGFMHQPWQRRKRPVVWHQWSERSENRTSVVTNWFTLSDGVKCFVAN